MIEDQAALKKAIENCENEPIRIPGLVQSHGILLVLRQSDLTILQISESVFSLIGVHPSELMHQPLSKLMDISPVEKACSRLGERMPRLLNPIPLEIVANGVTNRFDGILHRAGRVIILELERHVAEGSGYGGFGGFYEAVRETISRIMQAQNLEHVFQIGCEELRKLTGFGRVLVYAFDDDWNGNVIAESKESQIESLLHHRFPASDIPKQARELYTTNWLRLIPDVNYKPAKMVPQDNPMTGAPLDMTNAVLRSVSPVHLEYMRNMGQLASMSISLLKGQKLWGLISCHHPEPHFLKYDTRVAAEFIGQMMSAQIVAREESIETDQRLQLKGLYDDFLKNGGSYAEVPYLLQSNTSKLLALVDAPGAALIFGNEIFLMGTTPTKEQVARLTSWLNDRGEAVFSTDELSKLYTEEKLDLEKVAGILSIRITVNSPGRIIWFRPEMKEQIQWAGNPNLTKVISFDGKIHPRASFATWLENSSNRSKKWDSSEISISEEFRAVLAGLALKDGPTPGRGEINKAFRNSLATSLAQFETEESSEENPTAQRARARNIREAAENGRLLLEGFNEFAILFLNTTGVIENWSAGARKILGYTLDSAIGKDFEMIFSDSDRLTGKPLEILEAARSGQRVEEELWIFREGKSSFWGKIVIAQVVQDNKLLGFSVVIQDITEERASEEELRATKLAAEAANLAKTAFLANISHEIRTPVGAVLGFSEVMAQANQTDEQRAELYSRIKRNGDQLIALINDLLDVTKIEAGRLETESISIDLATLLSDVKDTFSIKTSEKSVNFSIEIRNALPSKIVSDPTRIRQILVNLLSNAIKFTEPGGTVTLACSMDRMLNDDKLSFRVIDTGRGMTEPEMSRLFQPFTQADVTTTRKYGGTGLGLFVSQRLARALGGDLNIEKSVYGEGTTFLARISSKVSDSSQTFTDLQGVAQTSRPIPTAKPVYNLEGKKILVVDDSSDNRQLVSLYMRSSGAELEYAENGEQGVYKALNGKYDLILMDIQMPVMDGNLAMKALVAAKYEVPVIALTANAMHREKEASLNVGFQDYLTKPIDKQSLLAAIQRWVH